MAPSGRAELAGWQPDGSKSCGSAAARASEKRLRRLGILLIQTRFIGNTAPGFVLLAPHLEPHRPATFRVGWFPALFLIPSFLPVALTFDKHCEFRVPHLSIRPEPGKVAAQTRGTRYRRKYTCKPICGFGFIRRDDEMTRNSLSDRLPVMSMHNDGASTTFAAGPRKASPQAPYHASPKPLSQVRERATQAHSTVAETLGRFCRFYQSIARL